MLRNVQRVIERWFTKHEDGEFAFGPRGNAYSIIGPTTARAPFVFTTKPRIVSALYEKEAAPACGVIGRPGLPSRSDLAWIGRLVGTRKLLFLGDMDPADLMMFAWARAGLHPTHVTFAGVNDALLKASGVATTGAFAIPLAESEQASLALLGEVVPDLARVVGRNCVQLLEAGRKIELEVLRGSRKGQAAMARALGFRGAAR